VPAGVLILGSVNFAQIKKIQSSDSTIYAYELEEIVSYGSKILPSPSMISEYNSDVLEKSGALTIADLLRNDPGLSITSGVKAETETKIRGFPAKDILVLVDGRPINPGYYGKVDLSMMQADNIAKINVVKGPSSVAYGINNMGGVIEIITKNGFDNPKTFLDVSVGENQFRKLTLGHGLQLGNFNYWISAYENFSNGFNLSTKFTSTSLEDGGLRENSAYHKAGGNLKVGFQSANNDLYSLSLGYSWAKKDVPTTIYSWDSPTFREFPEWQRYSSAISGQWNLDSDLQLKSIVYLDAYRDRLIDYKSREMKEGAYFFDSYLESWTAGGSLESKLTLFDAHQIHAGISFKRDLMNKQNNVGEPWETNLIYSGNIFLQDYFNLWEAADVTLGLSYSIFSTQENYVNNKLSPMISLGYNVFGGCRTYVSYANSIRVPTLHQLYSESSGNPDLKPEEANKAEVGVEWYVMLNDNNQYLSLQAAYFYNDLKNLIYRASSSYRYKNISEAALAGIELLSTFSYNQYLSADFSFGYLNSPGSDREILEHIPKKKFRLGFTGKTSFGFQINYELSYFDKRTTYLVTKNLESYMVHNLNISYELTSYLKLRADILNLSDENYEEELGYPAPGRIIIFGASVSL
jgi:iron complex outermembrane receptor protein